MPNQESSGQIEQFLILAKGQKSKALETIIDQILSHQHVFVFGEFLSLPNIQEMGGDNKHLRTLELFAYDNFQIYHSNRDRFIDLKPQQLKKLKMISIADLAQKTKVLHYLDLMRQLDILSLRELEDLIIDCMYNSLVEGKLDQLHQQFHVVHNFGRDVRQQDIDAMLLKLEDWDKQLEESQVLIETRVQSCNTSIMETYEKQLNQELEVRGRREQMIRDIEEGKDQEFGGSGPHNTLGKKRSSKRDRDRGDHDDFPGSGIGGFLSGLKQGFLNR
eukprot:403331239